MKYSQKKFLPPHCSKVMVIEAIRKTKKERFPHCQKDLSVWREIKWLNKNLMTVWDYGINEIMSSIIEVYHKKLWKFLNIFLIWLFLSYGFFTISFMTKRKVKYCSIFENLDNFQQPMEKAVEKCQRLNSLVHYQKLKNEKHKELCGTPCS